MTHIVERSQNYIFRALTFKDLKSCTMSHEKGRLKTFQDRLEARHQCYGHIDDKTNQPISYFWVTRGQNAPFDFGLRIRVSADETYIWDCRVDEPLRGQGLYPEGLSILCERAENNVYILSEKENTSSCKGIRKAGLNEKLKFSVLKIFGTRFLSFNKKIKILSSDTLSFKELS